MLLTEPFLTNFDPTNLPRPLVKWSYEPTQAQDVPAALMRRLCHGRAAADRSGVRVPAPGRLGQEMPDKDAFRTSPPAAPDRTDCRLADHHQRQPQAGAVSTAATWPQQRLGEGIALAERLQPRSGSGLSRNGCLPEDHPLFAGALPSAIGPVSKALAGHDLIVVIGRAGFSATTPGCRATTCRPGETAPDHGTILPKRPGRCRRQPDRRQPAWHFRP
jgi:benzoylformate decarboxylase